MSALPHTFPSGKSGPAADSRADPLVRAGRPRPALLPETQVSDTSEEPARGPAADGCVRPTTHAGHLAALDRQVKVPHTGLEEST